MRLALIAAAALALSACGGDKSEGRSRPQPAPSAPLGPMDPRAWEIGPVIRRRNYSVGMPSAPSPHPEGWAFDFPPPGGHVHALTFVHGTLAGKRAIVLRYRVEAEEGAKIVPQSAPALPSMLSLFFQRRGDDWSAQGEFEAYRWYSPQVHMPIEPGEHELAVSLLSENWTAVMSSSAFANFEAYAKAVSDCERVGFVLGGGDGRGHGVYSTGPARLIVTGFVVE